MIKIKDNLFYLWLFLKRPWSYIRLWREFGERPPREVLLVGNRDLTLEEKEYGEWLYITDGYGTYWERYCECGEKMSIMRPGEARCIVCYNKED